MVAQPQILEDEAAPDPENEPEETERLPRDADLLGRRDSACRKWLSRRIQGIITGFEDQAQRSDDLDTWWRMFNCELDQNQFYNGNAQVYVPIIRDAINARATRFANQLFPQSGRFVDATSTDGHSPTEIIALENHYIRRAQLKTAVVKPLLKNGDIEGQYNLYLDWRTIQRQIVSRETKGVVVEGAEDPEGEEIPDIDEEEIEEGFPGFEVLHDADVLILPQNADDIEDALQRGGSVTIVRRWSRETVRQMVDDGELRADCTPQGDELVIYNAELPGLVDTAKQIAKSVGVRVKGPHLLAFETWLMVPLSDKGAFSEKGDRRICRLWWGLDRTPYGLKRNPYWNDRVPLFSKPVEKIAGLVKGKSLAEPLAPLQWEACAAANERADSDHYAAMPIVRDGREGENAPLILNLGAVWKGKEIDFMAFPDLGPRASARIVAATQLIFQSLGINPAMLPQQSGRVGAKRNQAEVALEQSVDLLTTAEQVSVLEEGILTPMVEFLVDLDHQFRNRPLTVRAFGKLGQRAEMIDVPPLRNRAQYQFVWSGAEQARLNVAMQQQGTAFINVLRGMKQDIEAEGYRLRLGPILERQAVNIFGPIDGTMMLEDIRHQLSVSQDIENEMLAEGHMLPVSLFDPHQQHIMSAQQFMQQNGDPHGTILTHIREHMAAMALQAKAQLMAMAQGAQGVPGGAGPGVAGTPRPGGTPPGAQPGQPHAMKGPPGMIAPEAMPRAGAPIPPRRF